MQLLLDIHETVLLDGLLLEHQLNPFIEDAP